MLKKYIKSDSISASYFSPTKFSELPPIDFR